MKNKATPIERYRKSQRKRLAIKFEVFTHYFGFALKCARCPEADLRVLTMHHIEGGGCEHRNEISGWNSGGSTFYTALKNAGFPDGKYECLCFNCHTKHMYEQDQPQPRKNKTKSLTEKPKNPNIKPQQELWPSTQTTVNSETKAGE